MVLLTHGVRGASTQANTASAGMFALLRKRGHGDFRTTKVTAASQMSGWVLTKARKEEWSRADSSGFKDEAEFKVFLKEEVK